MTTINLIEQQAEIINRIRTLPLDEARAYVREVLDFPDKLVRGQSRPKLATMINNHIEAVARSHAQCQF